MNVQITNHPFIYIGLYHAHNGNITINDHIGNYTFYNKTSIDELNTMHLHLTNPSIYKLNKNLILYNFEIDNIVYIIACRKGFVSEGLNWFRKDNISKELSKGLANDLHKLKLWKIKNEEGLLTEIAEKTLKLAVEGFVKRNEDEKKKKGNENDKVKGNDKENKSKYKCDINKRNLHHYNKINISNNNNHIFKRNNSEWVSKQIMTICFCIFLIFHVYHLIMPFIIN
jgi:hypothetical protein